MKNDVSYKALRTLPSAYDKDSIDFIMIFVSFFLLYLFLKMRTLRLRQVTCLKLQNDTYLSQVWNQGFYDRRSAPTTPHE